ncbi:MAG: dihydrodipicolinate synthetase [Planctomycetes bacterium]|jgi:N-acetylneuraminate lyase|nr:dihydrodipicolinate synthetase [Planctomycetota bacterium]
MSRKTEGLIAAPFTAFHQDGSLDLSVIQRQAEGLVRAGVRGAFICGTTGESLSLTLDERRLVAQRWVEVAGSELTIIVHTGHNCLSDARALAQHAQEIGAAATGAFGPGYFRPSCLADLVEWCAAVAGGAPNIPFYYYHIPSLTGLHFSMPGLLTAAAGRIANLGGLKFTHENMMEYSQALAAVGGRYDVLFGRDEALLSALAVGARGAVGSTYNYSAPVYLRVMEAFDAGRMDDARRHQAKAVEFIDLLIEYGGLPAGKAIMKMSGVDCGPVRLPLRSLDDEQYRRLHDRLDAAGFFALQKLA